MQQKTILLVMKKIINNPMMFVQDTLCGIYYAHQDEVTFTDGSRKAMVKKQRKPGKVALCTGGGSGHLPLFLGYIGQGMLDGCSVGEVFASPSVNDMLSVTKAVDNGAGVLYLYGNYGGDKMNFTMAAEQADFESGIRVLSVLGMDDVAVEEPAHRRGIAGIFFVYKCAGAAAEEMMSLDECYRIAKKTADNLRTMGVSLSACTLPRVGHPSFEIADDEMEIGMGIHGEPGIRRGKIMTAEEITNELLAKILPELDLKAGDETAVLVNGLGATPLEEQYIVTKRIYEVLSEKGIHIFHTYVGEHATSMEMAGLSISVLKLDDELKRLLAAPADAIMFKQFQLDVNKTYEQVDLTEHQQTEEAFVNQEPVGKTDVNTLTAEDFVKLFGALKVMADREKDELIRLDSVAGDGDMGLSMADGFAAVQHYLEGKTFSDIGELFYRVGKKMQASAASSMGTLVAFGFMGVGKAFRGRTEIRCQELGDLLAAFEQAIMKLGGAKPGDKTFLDGLHPAVEVLKSATTDDEARALLPRAAQAAKEGSDKTTTMVARFGRIAFRGEASRSILDPGSVLAAFIVRTLAESI